MTRILCVRLTCWPIDRIRRKRPELRRDPLALVQTSGAAGTRQVVAEACARARAGGVRRGMTLAEARAICPELAHAPHEPEHDRRGLVRLGRWLMRYSPVVSPAPPDALFLDVGGFERMYRGDLGVLLKRIGDALRAMKVGARLALAPNPGAAWAVASAGEDADETAGRIVTTDGLAAALAPLPPGALRLDPVACALLAELGVDSIGQLATLPRDALPARFGATLLERLDAAFGRTAEPLVPLQHRELVEAGMEFDGPVASLEALWHVFHELLRRLVSQLAGRGAGAREVRAEFRRTGAPATVKVIRLSRPSRDPVALFNLLRCALETVGDDEGFDGIRLAVPAFERLTDAQLLLLGREEREAQEELGALIDLLSARLGPRAVVQPQPVASHLPDRAYRLTEAVAAGSAARCDRRSATRGNGVNRTSTSAAASQIATGPRPLCLFPVPVEVTAVVSPSLDGDGPPASFTRGGDVHRLLHVDGPERISGLWWEGRRKTRDYFDVETETGRRFWLFRVLETGRWYLHGVFE